MIRLRSASTPWTWVLLPFWILACSPAERSVEPAKPTSPIRLVDLVESAEIESLLQSEEVQRAKALPETVQSSDDPTWMARFDELRASYRLGCVLGSGELECTQRDEWFRLLLELPPERSAPIELRVDLDAPDPRCLEVEMWDEVERKRMPFPPGPPGRRTVSWRWPARRQDAPLFFRISSRPVAGPCSLRVWSAAAHRLELTLEQLVADLANRSPMTGAGDLGMVQFGTFLPLSDAETVLPPFDQNFGSREALFTPAPTSVRFRHLAIPRQGELSFSYGLSAGSQPGDTVEFEVLAIDGSGERSLWSRELRLDESNWAWNEARVPIGDLAGSVTDLVLRTRSPAARGLAFWGTPVIDAPRRQDDPPNVVLIAVDTLRSDRLGLYGHPSRQQSLERLADDGILFADVVTQSNWTIPSFASIFSGSLVPRHREATIVSHVAPTLPSLPMLFRAHGWRTEAVLYKPALYRRLDEGFERSFNVPRRRHRAEQNVARALDALDRLGDRRFFLFLHFNDPHQPFNQPDEFVADNTRQVLADHALDLPLQLPQDLRTCETCRSDEGIDSSIKTMADELYDQSIRYLDEQIGIFLDALSAKGLYDDTLIVFLSDHGETLWDRMDYFSHGGVNLHPELTRVPMILKLPSGTARPGFVVDARVRVFDIMPTLLEAVGIELPDSAAIDATSLLPLIEGKADTSGNRDVYAQSATAAAFVHDRWKIILPIGLGVDPVDLEAPRLDSEGLWDMTADPDERVDLAATEPELLGTMRALLFEHLLGAVGGRFLLVRGDESQASRPVRVSCTPECAWDPLVQFGRQHTATSTDSEPGRDAAPTTTTNLFEGPGLGDGVALFARLSDAVTAPTEIRILAGNGETRVVRPVEWTPGALRELLGARRPGAWILTAPLRPMNRELVTSLIDAQQEEALRALGYLP